MGIGWGRGCRSRPGRHASQACPEKCFNCFKGRFSSGVRRRASRPREAPFRPAFLRPAGPGRAPRGEPRAHFHAWRTLRPLSGRPPGSRARGAQSPIHPRGRCLPPRAAAGPVPHATLGRPGRTGPRFKTPRWPGRPGPLLLQAPPRGLAGTRFLSRAAEQHSRSLFGGESCEGSPRVYREDARFHCARFPPGPADGTVQSFLSCERTLFLLGRLGLLSPSRPPRKVHFLTFVSP